MDLALSTIDFIEVFQGGYLNDERWYELLNAGLRDPGHRRQRLPGQYRPAFAERAVSFPCSGPSEPW